MLAPRSASSRLARDARGFTLIETLVALVSGLVVLGAAFSILEVALHQSARLTDVAQATQLGRTTMTRIVDDLHSACIAPAFSPIQEKSSEKKLVFVNAFSEKAEIATATAEPKGQGAFKHEIVYEGKSLIDKTYPSNGGTWPNKFTWAEKPTSAIIGTNISQTGTTPIFQYYAYATTPNTAATAASSTLNEKEPLAVKSELTTAQAEEAASVRITFTTAPGSGTVRPGRSADLSNQVTLAFSAPSTEAVINQSPCE